jgi:ABC-type amino acid transport system permease subunit
MLRLLIDGIEYSLLLVAGSLIATALFGFLFGRAGTSRFAVLRLGVSAITSLGQTTPMPLLMFFGYVVVGGITQYSAPVSLLVAITVLGFYNGCYVGVAIRDARRIAEGAGGLAASALILAWPQMSAFLVNATKASPAADLIGVPEFLSVLTDLTAYSRDRVGVYLILLIFYSTLVLMTIWGLSFIRTLIGREAGRHA